MIGIERRGGSTVSIYLALLACVTSVPVAPSSANMASCEGGPLLYIILVSSLIINIGLICGVIQCQVAPCTVVSGDDSQSIARSDTNYGLVLVADESTDHCDCLSHPNAPFEVLEILTMIALSAVFSFCCYKATKANLVKRKMKKSLREERIRKKVRDELSDKEQT